MMVQEDIISQLSSSIDIKKISSHIMEAIIDLKKIGFSALYSNHNKHANYAIQETEQK